MNIHKIILVLLLIVQGATLANQINVHNVRKVTAPINVVGRQDNSEEQDLDGFVDFETEGEIEVTQSNVEKWLAKLAAPFFQFYNWLNKDSFYEA